MKHARYVGSDPKLLGRSALIREMGRGQVLAQFDLPTSIWKVDSPQMQESHPECFGWTPLPNVDFLPTEDMPNEVTPL